MSVPARDLGQEMKSLSKALSRAGLEGQEGRLLQATISFLEEEVAARDAEPIVKFLSQAERKALKEAGVEVLKETENDPLLSVVARHAAMTTSAIPLSEAAMRMGVNPSRLRQRLTEGSLVGVRDPLGRSWLIPLFQLTEEGELPGLRVVLRAVRDDARPVQILAFFETPQPDLEDENGEAMTPLAWLRGHGDPQVVAALVQDI